MKLISSNKDSIKLLPDLSGVYMFLDSKNNVLYVGKAINLKNRVNSYFAQKLEPKTRMMVGSAKNIRYITVSSEFEALLLEARLVKKYQPKYNIELRDDKSPLYIGITRDELPRVILLRQRELDKYKLRDVFGPFINSGAPKWVLRELRKIFPYATHKPSKRLCVYNQIGLCNPCPSEICRAEGDTVEYQRLIKEYSLNVRRLKAVMSGRSKTILHQLEDDMKIFSKLEQFEKAAEMKKKIDALVYTTSRQELNNSYVENPNLLDDIRARELNQLKKIISQYHSLTKLRRIECFDVAHLGGSFPTASMVTFVDGNPDKSLYRHYKVSDKKINNDVLALKSVLAKRKFRFDLWGKPDLIIVDGGKGQLSGALEVISEVPVIGLAKREETLIFRQSGEFVEFKLPDSPAKKLVQRIRDEAHRFARTYHHKLVSRAIREA